MELIKQQAKNVALKIQEALRGTVQVDIESALELAEHLVTTHGINKVATVEGLRQFAAAELRALADDILEDEEDKRAFGATEPLTSDSNGGSNGGPPVETKPPVTAPAGEAVKPMGETKTEATAEATDSTQNESAK